MKKKLALAASTLAPFLAAATALAQTPTPPSITVKRPEQGFVTIGDFISKTLTFAFLLAILVVLVMLVWGAFEWITSGGDKDNVGKARNKIINALIGLAVLAVAFALARVGTQFLGFPDITTGIPVPRPDPSASGL